MLEITIACGSYDRTALLRRHQLTIPNVSYNFLPLTPAETFWRMLKQGEFDVCEMSLGSYSTSVAQGDTRFVAIPVFPSRAYRHGNIFVREDSPITTPEQLKGQRVGLAEYEMTASIWIRGFLADDYGVHPRDVEWLTGREEKVSGIPYDPAIRVSHFEGGDVDEGVARGELAATIGATLPVQLGSGLRRVLPDYQSIEEDYFRRTRIFPIMHTLVIRRELLDAQPWLANSLFDAFSSAKAAAYERAKATQGRAYGAPWVAASLERARETMGDDPWPYGLEANAPTLDAFLRYLEEQGLTRSRLSLTDLFLDTAGS